ncbi:hypothetical protein GGR54DRAFT_638094 [Hypoxylon sp. NC1633]|nr:hypothetical protein GGR54DRAFT_638094 [Hypoxylon sp. NC1633]
MSLYRWSLPSRSLTREKSKDRNSSQGSRFPTIHIGNPNSRRRANISSAFASLFERDENSLNTTTTDGAHFAGKELQPLSTRTENFKPRNENHDAPTHRPDTPTYTNGESDKFLPKQDKVPKKVRLASLLKERAQSVNSAAVDGSGAIKSPESLVRIRSASSSYPSEGIRSPPDHCRSPQVNTWSKSFMSEMSRYGTYPSPETSTDSSISTNDLSIDSIIDGKVGQCLMVELDAAGGISDTDTRTTSGDCTSKSPVSEVTSLTSSQQQQDQPLEDELTTGTEVQNIQGLSRLRENAIPILDGQGSSTSVIQRNCPGYQPSIRISSSADEMPFQQSDACSTDRLRPSTESRATHSNKIRWQNQGHAYNTMPAFFSPKSALRRPSTATTVRCHSDDAHLPELQFKHADISSTTLVQRIQKFKFRKWIRKVCLRTKVRFDNAIKIEASPRSLGKKSKSQKPRRPKKRGKAKGAKPKATKTPYVSSKAAKGHGGKTHRFIRALRPKNSIQLPVQEKPGGGHRRVQSCPT